MKSDKIVRASELSQYEFCSMYHYLVKNGAKIGERESKRLEEGTSRHLEHGKRINISRKVNRSLTYLIILLAGVLILVLLLSIF